MKVGEFNDPELTQAFSEIMDVFAGADGGVAYVRLMRMFRGFEEEAKKPETKTSATYLINIAKQFHKLVKIAREK